ncbi:MAG: response regulator transcription factor [bacterium]
MRILIVDDDKNICKQVQFLFAGKGFAVDVAHTAGEGYYYIKEYPLDAAILDVGLPDYSGIELIRRVRKLSIMTPILLLTGRTMWQDKVEGLDAGADDYLTKPVHLKELQARVNALIRRSTGHAQPILSHGNIKLDTMAQEVKVAGTKIELTAFEYKILEYLMLRKGEVISKTVLTDHVYAENSDRDSNVIEVFVGRLRSKLDPTGVNKPIETLRGRGYRIVGEHR